MNLKNNFRKKWALLALMCCAVLGACDKVSEFEDYSELIYGEWYCDTEYVDGILITAENSGDNMIYYNTFTYIFVRPDIAYLSPEGSIGDNYAWTFSIFKNYLVFALADYVRKVEIVELTKTTLVLKEEFADKEISIQYYNRTDVDFDEDDFEVGEDDFSDANG